MPYSIFYILYSKKNKGQALIEVLVASGIIAIVAVSAMLMINSALISQKKTKDAHAASQLLIEAQEAIRALAEKDWQYYISTTTPVNRYSISTTTSGWLLSSSTQVININGINYTRYLTLDNVLRDDTVGNQDDKIVSSGGTIDPATKKLTVYVSWPNGAILSFSEYITRYYNETWVDTDWSGGFAAATTLTNPGNIFSTSTGINHSATAGQISLIASSTQGYYLATGTLMSQIYDLGHNLNATSGIVLNSVFWKGTGCSGCKAWFQFAASNSTSGPWADSNFLGYDGTSAVWYGGTTLPNNQIKIRRIDFDNKRYFRYKIFLESSTNYSETPAITDIILNWIR